MNGVGLTTSNVYVPESRELRLACRYTNVLPGFLLPQFNGGNLPSSLDFWLCPHCPGRREPFPCLQFVPVEQPPFRRGLYPYLQPKPERGEQRRARVLSCGVSVP